MPNLVVNQPPNNLMVPPNQPFLVAGQASDRGMPEPIMIDSVTVQVDNGPLIDATLTHIPNKTLTVFGFKALARVTGGQDPHTVTVTATNDNEISVTKTVTVFTGPIFEVDAPAVLIEISPFSFDVNDPKIVHLMSEISQSLTDLSASLGSVGKMLAGPNWVTATNPQGDQVLRVGLWIEDTSFPVLPPAPPSFPLPRLSDPAAVAGFNTVSLLPVPKPAGLGPAFAVFIATSTLQGLLDAVAPIAKAAASQQNVSLDTLTVSTFPPASVITNFSGSLPLSIPFSITITETLGTKQLPTSIQMVPAVIGSSHSASVGDVLDWFIGVLFPIFLLALAGALGAVSSAAGQIEGQITGLMGPLIAAIPSRIPFRNTDLPPLPVPLPDFPTLLPNWKSFGVTADGVLGTGTTTIEARDESRVVLTISGAGRITGAQEDLAGGAGQTYGITLVDILPDPDKFNWQVTGTGSEQGSINLGPFGQAGNIGVVFPLPLTVKPGTYPFTLAVNATETCGTDPTKTLSATNSKAVKVVVLKNPNVPP